MSAKKSFLLRIPPDLWDELNRWAKDELRSVNGQIEFLLREATKRRRSDKKEEKRKAKTQKRGSAAPPPDESSDESSTGSIGGSWSAEFD